MAKFKKGDVCIVIAGQYINEEITLLSDAYWEDRITTGGEICYKCKFKTVTFAEERALRLKEYPGEKIITRMFELPIEKLKLLEMS